MFSCWEMPGGHRGAVTVLLLCQPSVARGAAVTGVGLNPGDWRGVGFWDQGKTPSTMARVNKISLNN